MSRKKSRDGRASGPFVMLLKDTMASGAWRAMSHGARSLNTAVRCRHNSKRHNNGRLYLSQRDASRELGSWSNEIARWYRENQFYGFLRMTKGGSLGVDGKGKAPHWRLTDLPCDGEPPTRDFAKWDGAKFKDTERRTRKTKSRKGNQERGVREIKDTTVREIKNTIWNNRKGNHGHM
jgi:hypothetical protein